MFGQKRIPSRYGGVEIVVEQLSTRMAKQGHEVICYNRRSRQGSAEQTEGRKCSDYKGVKLRSVPTWDQKGLAAVTSSFFAALFASLSRAEVVHIHAEGPAFFSWIPKLFGKRVIVTVHGLDWQRAKWKNGFAAGYIRAGEKMAVRCADEIIVLSRNAQNYFRKTYGRDTVRIPNGIPEPAHREASLITEQFGLQKDGYILYLGRLVPEKGIHYLIEAYRQLHTDKQLVIAGGSSDTDEYCRQLKQMAAGDGKILFTGFVQGQLLEELFSNAYVYVLPSDVEGMPLSLLEAMSYGNCCLVSDIPECVEVVEDKAMTFQQGNVKDLTNRLQAFCDDSQQVLHLKSAAKHCCREMCSWDEVTERTLELYQ